MTAENSNSESRAAYIAALDAYGDKDATILHNTKLDIAVIDERTHAALYDGSFHLIDYETNHMVRTFESSTMIANFDIQTGELLPEDEWIVRGRTYLIIESKTPNSPDYEAPEPVPRKRLNPIKRIKDVIKNEEDIAEEYQRDQDAAAIEEYSRFAGTSITIPLDTTEIPFVELPHKKKVSFRDTGLDDFIPRQVLTAIMWLTMYVVAAALWCYIAVPFIWGTIFGLACSTSLGFLWGIQNFWAYLTQYLFCGWAAVARLNSLYPSTIGINVLTTLVSVGLFGVVAYNLNKSFDKATAPKNELLESLPPVAGHNELGSSRLITEPKEIASELQTVSQDVEHLKEAGIVLGSIPESNIRTVGKLLSHVGTVIKWRISYIGSKITRSPLPPKPAFTLAANKFVYSDKDENSVVIGDTRAGKTRRFLLPTIDLLSRCEKESMVIIDPKGELYGLTAKGLRRRGVPLVRIDFRYPMYSSCVNFMQTIIDAARMGKRPTKEYDTLQEYLMHIGDWNKIDQAAGDLVNMLLPPELDTGVNAYFNNGARTYIKSMAIYVACHPNIPEDQRSLSTVSRIIENYGQSVAEDPSNISSKQWVPYLMMLEEFPRNHPAVEAFGMARGVVPKERSAFVTTAQQVLRDFRDSNIARMTTKTDSPMSLPGLKRTAVFIIIPHEKTTYATFANILLQQYYQALVTESTKHGNRLPVRVNFICEEFGQVPPIPELQEKLNVSLGCGIRWTLILQSIAQLALKYGKDSQAAMIPACENKIIIKSTDIEGTGKWFSDLLGAYTISTESSSKSGKRISLFKENASASSQLQKRMVLLPEEVTRWRANWGTLMSRGAAAASGFVIPLPDVSETITTQAFGLGSPEQNRRLMETTLYSDEQRNQDETIDPWSPELVEMRMGKKYNENERRIAEKEYIKHLLEVKAQLDGSGKAGKKQTKPKSDEDTRYACFWNTKLRTHTNPYPIVSEEHKRIASLSKYQGEDWELLIRQDKKALKNTCTQRMNNVYLTDN